jgi:replicative DNA helicase
MPKKETSQFKLPPQDIEAEKSVLGSLMLDKNAIVNVADFLLPSDFYENKHQKIYSTIIELWSKGEPVDILTVSHELKAKKELSSVGGIEYLTELADSVPTSAHLEHYAKIVKEQRVRRDLIAAASEISEKAFNDKNFEDLIETVEQKIFGISQKSRPQKFTLLKEELPAAYERFEKLHRGEKNVLRGIPTFFTELDKILSGLQPSDLIIVGARPSYGKTAFVLDIARQAAVKGGKSVGIFSIEMSKEQIIDRIIASQAQIPLWRLRTGKLENETEFAQVQEALNELSNAKIFIEDTPSPTILQMRSMARRLQIEHGIDLLIIDYLQLIQPRTSSDSMVQQVTEISRGLKALARELNVPVVAVSQLSRDVDKRPEKIPRLSDLRESGSLEQDADVVLFIYRKDKNIYSLDTEEDNIVEIIIAKHRNGPTGSIKLYFNKEKVSFHNLETTFEEEF